MNPAADTGTLDPTTAFDVLADPECRAVILALDTPTTAAEIADETGIPPSTLYRKLAELEDADLLARSHRVTAMGRHPRQYERRFDRLSVVLDAGREGFDISLQSFECDRRPPGDPVRPVS